VKKRIKTALWATAALALAALALALWQRENISAYIAARRHTAAELESMMAEHEEATGRILEKLPADIRAPTQEEVERMGNGQLTEKEMAQLLLKPPDSAGGATGAERTAEGTEETAGTPPTTEQGEKDEEAAQLVARIYALRSEMAGGLEGLAAKTEAEYKALPEEERTAAKKQALAAKSLAEAAALERRSDAEMGEILAQLKETLGSSGAGTAKEIEAAYATEKSLKKSWYMKQYS
jgi:hypothetical protein